MAKILEIRAEDAEKVYARVAWMYRPEELPNGRQRYHGKHELIASNLSELTLGVAEMRKLTRAVDIIYTISVTEHAKVEPWTASGDDGKLKDFYWRQGFDARTSELSVCLVLDFQLRIC